MVVADVARAALALTLVLLPVSLPLIYGVAFGLSAGALVFNPAVSSLVPELVDADELIEANSALWTVAVTAQVILAPIAGALVAGVGADIAFSVNAVSYLLSAAFLWRLKARVAPADITVKGWTAVLAGVVAVRDHPLLARLAIVQVLAALSAGATSGLLVVLASDWLRVGPSGFGLLLSAIGLGAALGPILLRRFIAAGSRGWLFGPFALRGAVDLVLATFRSPLLAGSALVAYGMSTSTGMVAYQTTLQTYVPESVRGRAFTFYDVLWNGARLLSLGAGGILADTLGIRTVYVMGGVLLLAAAAVGATYRLPAPVAPQPAHIPPKALDTTGQPVTNLKTDERD